MLVNMNYLQKTRQTLLDLPRRSIALFVTTFYAPDKWYQHAWYLTGLLARLKRRTSHIAGRSSGILHAHILDGVLLKLNQSGKAYFIPVSVKGLEHIKSVSLNGRLLLGLHIPLIRVAMAVAQVESEAPVSALYVQEDIPVLTGILYGIRETMPLIFVGPMVLGKVLSKLLKGETVSALVDFDLGLGISDSMFRLAEKYKTPLSYYMAELLSDGTIEVSFSEPTPSPEPENEVKHRLGELQMYITGILRRYGDTGIGDYTSAENRAMVIAARV